MRICEGINKKKTEVTTFTLILAAIGVGYHFSEQYNSTDNISKLVTENDIQLVLLYLGVKPHTSHDKGKPKLSIPNYIFLFH